MKIGLTGANGFVGNIIKTELKKDGHEVFELRTDEFNNFYTLDALIHCARQHKNIIDKEGKLTKYPTKEQWLDEFNTDVYLPYQFTEMMISKNYNLKNIIFISSIYGIIPPTIREIPLNYVTCKAAEFALAKNLAVRYAPNIRVNTVILGGVRSDRKEADQPKDFLDKYHKKTLLQQMVQPDEICGAIKFLLSKDSKGMTGAEIKIDGGYGLC